jgi:hypothetical protein
MVPAMAKVMPKAAHKLPLLAFSGLLNIFSPITKVTELIK